MVRYFAPNLIWNGNGNPWPNMDVEGNRTNTGDGYKLGYWAGASIQQYQCSQMHVMGGPGDTDSQNDSMGFTGPLLRINYNGERFMNEDTCAADAEYPIELQPKHKCFMITDSHFEENAAKCVNTFAATLAEWDERVGDGTIFKGQTLRELFESIDGMDVDAALATVERYNELAKKGNDDDFGKPAEKMVAIENGPFYLAKLGYSFFFEVGGIATDKQRRVLDVDSKPIPGLYAIGNDGNMLYRHVYTINMPGTAFGNQVNSGREAANNVAEFLKA